MKGVFDMSKVYVPKNYKPLLSVYETQDAIEIIKRTFEKKITEKLNIRRVSAPLFVDSKSGLNDDLNGVERAVSFDIKETGTNAQIVHSLAKWKRKALKDYGFSAGEGLYTNMNAIRRDEDMDNIHSIYVDQWDWEKVITSSDRTVSYLKETVNSIADAIYETFLKVNEVYPKLNSSLVNEVSFITSQELEDLYPDLTAKERENAYTKEKKCVFLMKIGGILKSGKKHDGRAPDYDDWELNGDLLYWNETLDSALELSSMGIRVDKESLERQLKESGCEDRKTLPFHKALLNDELPLTMGGGIGQSRLCMLLLKKAHIGEVQVSIWDDKTREVCEENNIKLL